MTDPYLQLIRKIRTDELSNLFKKPKRETGPSAPSYDYVYDEDIYHQADLLFLPKDKGYRYALVVTDVATRKSDAEPLKTKMASEVAEAFKKIYKRGILKVPARIRMDDGKEFKGKVKKLFDSMNVFVLYAKPGRHRQLAVVEATNKYLAKALLRRMIAQELLTGQPSREWVKILPKIIKLLNSIRVREPPKPPGPTDFACEKESCDIIPIGTRVRALLDNPIDIVTGKRLHGRFRVSDIRWDPEIRWVKDFLIRPGSPPLYFLNDVKDYNKTDYSVGYTRGQLQIVDDRELPPDTRLIVGKPSTYVVNKIIGKKKRKGRIYYKVLWKGYSKKEATWEPRSQLIKEIPELIEEYERSIR